MSFRTREVAGVSSAAGQYARPGASKPSRKPRPGDDGSAARRVPNWSSTSGTGPSSTRTILATYRRLEYLFETDVFVNCPFDDKYTRLLRPLLFTLVDLG